MYFVVSSCKNISLEICIAFVYDHPEEREIIFGLCFLVFMLEVLVRLHASRCLYLQA